MRRFILQKCMVFLACTELKVQKFVIYESDKAHVVQYVKMLIYRSTLVFNFECFQTHLIYFSVSRSAVLSIIATTFFSDMLPSWQLIKNWQLYV